MALFKFTCPGCKSTYKVELFEGIEQRYVTCPQCQKTFIVKAPKGPPATPAPAESNSPATPPPLMAELSEPSSAPAVPTADAVGATSENGFPSDRLFHTPIGASQASSTPSDQVPESLQPYAPPIAVVSVAETHACPLCGRTDRHYSVRGKMLYDHKVCRKCSNSFLNRRQLAFIVDIFVMYVLSLSSGFVGGFIIGFLVASSQGGLEERDLAAIEGLFNFVGFGIYGLWFLLKDGFNGASPGKAMMGIRVINEHTGHMIGFGGSAKRNWIIVLLGIIPFAWLIIAILMGKGYRIGDQWAGTKVIWKKYQQSPVFGPKRAAMVGSELSAYSYT